MAFDKTKQYPIEITRNGEDRSWREGDIVITGIGDIKVNLFEKGYPIYEENIKRVMSLDDAIEMLSSLSRDNSGNINIPKGDTFINIHLGGGKLNILDEHSKSSTEDVSKLSASELADKVGAAVDKALGVEMTPTSTMTYPVAKGKLQIVETTDSMLAKTVYVRTIPEDEAVRLTFTHKDGMEMANMVVIDKGGEVFKRDFMIGDRDEQVIIDKVCDTLKEDFRRASLGNPGGEWYYHSQIRKDLDSIGEEFSAHKFSQRVFVDGILADNDDELFSDKLADVLRYETKETSIIGRGTSDAECIVLGETDMQDFYQNILKYAEDTPMGVETAMSKYCEGRRLPYAVTNVERGDVQLFDVHIDELPFNATLRKDQVAGLSSKVMDSDAVQNAVFDEIIQGQSGTHLTVGSSGNELAIYAKLDDNGRSGTIIMVPESTEEPIEISSENLRKEVSELTAQAIIADYTGRSTEDFANAVQAERTPLVHETQHEIDLPKPELD